MSADPRMQFCEQTLPLDGKRMVFGGFEVTVDEGPLKAFLQKRGLRTHRCIPPPYIDAVDVYPPLHYPVGSFPAEFPDTLKE